MMRTSEYELVIPFSLLGVNPKEMDDFDELWRTVELKMMTRFYLMSCYKKLDSMRIMRQKEITYMFFRNG